MPIVTAQTPSKNSLEYVLALVMTASPKVPPGIYYRLEQMGHTLYDKSVLNNNGLSQSEYMGFQLVSLQTWEYLYRVQITSEITTTKLSDDIRIGIENNWSKFNSYMQGTDQHGKPELIWDSVSTSVEFRPFYQECDPIRYIDPSTVTSAYPGDVITIFPCGDGLCRKCISGEACANELDCQYTSRCLVNNVCSLIGNNAVTVAPSMTICILGFLGFVVLLIS